VKNWWYVLGVGTAVTVLLSVDRSSSDIANQASLLILVGACGVLGFVRPGRAWLTAGIVGAAIPIAHLVYTTVGPELAYQVEPAGVPGALLLMVLLVPATVSALAGALVARRVSR
jgi:hypothetical protein